MAPPPDCKCKCKPHLTESYSDSDYQSEFDGNTVGSSGENDEKENQPEEINTPDNKASQLDFANPFSYKQSLDTDAITPARSHDWSAVYRECCEILTREQEVNYPVIDIPSLRDEPIQVNSRVVFNDMPSGCHSYNDLYEYSPARQLLASIGPINQSRVRFSIAPSESESHTGRRTVSDDRILQNKDSKSIRQSSKSRSPTPCRLKLLSRHSRRPTPAPVAESSRSDVSLRLKSGSEEYKSCTPGSQSRTSSPEKSSFGARSFEVSEPEFFQTGETTSHRSTSPITCISSSIRKALGLGRVEYCPFTGIPRPFQNVHPDICPKHGLPKPHPNHQQLPSRNTDNIVAYFEVPSTRSSLLRFPLRSSQSLRTVRSCSAPDPPPTCCRSTCSIRRTCSRQVCTSTSRTTVCQTRSQSSCCPITYPRCSCNPCNVRVSRGCSPRRQRKCPQYSPCSSWYYNPYYYGQYYNNYNYSPYSNTSAVSCLQSSYGCGCSNNCSCCQSPCCSINLPCCSWWNTCNPCCQSTSTTQNQDCCCTGNSCSRACSPCDCNSCCYSPCCCWDSCCGQNNSCCNQKKSCCSKSCSTSCNTCCETSCNVCERPCRPSPCRSTCRRPCQRPSCRTTCCQTCCPSSTCGTYCCRRTVSKSCCTRRSTTCITRGCPSVASKCATRPSCMKPPASLPSVTYHEPETVQFDQNLNFQYDPEHGFQPQEMESVDPTSGVLYEDASYANPRSRIQFDDQGASYVLDPKSEFQFQNLDAPTFIADQIPSEAPTYITNVALSPSPAFREPMPPRGLHEQHDNTHYGAQYSVRPGETVQFASGSASRRIADPEYGYRNTRLSGGADPSMGVASRVQTPMGQSQRVVQSTKSAFDPGNPMATNYSRKPGVTRPGTATSLIAADGSKKVNFILSPHASTFNFPAERSVFYNADGSTTVVTSQTVVTEECVEECCVEECCCTCGPPICKPSPPGCCTISPEPGGGCCVDPCCEDEVICCSCCKPPPCCLTCCCPCPRVCKPDCCFHGKVCYNTCPLEDPCCSCCCCGKPVVRNYCYCRSF